MEAENDWPHARADASRRIKLYLRLPLEILFMLTLSMLEYKIRKF